MGRAPRNLGAVYEIELPDGRFAYAQKLVSPLYAFFDVASERHLAIDEVLPQNILFRIWVRSLAVKDGNWRRIGSRPPAPDLLVSPWFQKTDRMNGAVTIYRERPDLDQLYEEHLSTREEVADLEPAAVWEAHHISERLVDHFAGRPCRILESLKNPVIPRPTH